MRTSIRGERAVAVARDPQLDVADFGCDRLGAVTVARVLKRRGVGITGLITEVLGQLGVQPSFQGRLQQRVQQARFAGQRLTGIHLGEHVIKGTRRDQRIGLLVLYVGVLHAKVPLPHHD